MSNHKKPIKAAIIVVAYGHETSIGNTLDAIAEDKYAQDSVILVDNHPQHRCAAIAKTHKAVDHVVESDNHGFGAGCNLGANYAKEADMLYFLNPDAVPQKNFLSEIKKAYADRPEWKAWMSLLLLPNGKVNSAGNVVHLSGLSWVLGYGKPASDYTVPMEVTSLSGACLAIRKSSWDELSGFTTDYFLYYEDTELSSRMLLRGWKMGLWPSSQVLHDYDFKKNNKKWFYLERNRYVYILSSWPIAVIILLSPLLLACELGLWLVSLMQRRFLLRLRSFLSFLKIIPSLPRLRRHAQIGRKISSRSFASSLAADLHNPFLGRISEIGLISDIFAAYKYLVIACLKIGR
jgi:GT2 family glycosyltransferase